MREPTADFTTVAIVYRFPEAAVLVSMLRAYGIPAFAPAWQFATTAWHLTVAIGGIMVLVPSRDLDKAVFLIGDPGELPVPPRAFRCGLVCNALLALLLSWVPARVRGVYAACPALDDAASPRAVA